MRPCTQRIPAPSSSAEPLTEPSAAPNAQLFHTLRDQLVQRQTGTIYNLAKSRLWYQTPDQAQGFLALSESSAYAAAITQRECSLLSLHATDIARAIGAHAPFNLIDLGCGDGSKACLVAQGLTRHGLSNFRYCPTDVSSFMIERALQAFQRQPQSMSTIAPKWNVGEFENLANIGPLFRDPAYPRSAFLLLGNTLGNFDLFEILSYVHAGMREGDVLILGNGLADSRAVDWAAAYSHPLIEKWLLELPRKLTLPRSALAYQVLYSREDSRVEELFALRQDSRIQLHHHELQLRAGDLLRVAISYKHSRTVLEEALRAFFADVRLFTDASAAYCVAICGGKRSLG